MTNIDWEKLYKIAEDIVELDKMVARFVFLSPDFKVNSYRKTNSFRALSSSIDNAKSFHNAITTKENIQSLSHEDKKELFKLLIVKSTFEKKVGFNPAKLTFLNDNAFEIKKEYLNSKNEIPKECFIYEYISKIIKEEEICVIDKVIDNSEPINSENFLLFNLVNARTFFKKNMDYDGLFKNKFELTNEDEINESKQIIKELFDYLADKNSQKRGVDENFLWITTYGKVFENSSQEEMKKIAEAFERVLNSQIPEWKMPLLRILLTNIDYYEIHSLSINEKKINNLISNKVFNDIVVDDVEKVIVNLNKLACLQIMINWQSVNNGKKMYYLATGGETELRDNEKAVIKMLKDLNEGVYDLKQTESPFKNEVFEKYFIDYYINSIIQKGVIDPEAEKQEVIEILSMLKEEKDWLSIHKEKMNILNDVLKGFKTKELRYQSQDGGYIIFKKDENKHLNIKPILEVLYLDYAKDADFKNKLEIEIQKSLMEKDVVSINASKIKLKKF